MGLNGSGLTLSTLGIMELCGLIAEKGGVLPGIINVCLPELYEIMRDLPIFA